MTKNLFPPTIGGGVRKWPLTDMVEFIIGPQLSANILLE
jgi:hypothetical protein